MADARSSSWGSTSCVSSSKEVTLFGFHSPRRDLTHPCAKTAIREGIHPAHWPPDQRNPNPADITFPGRSPPPQSPWGQLHHRELERRALAEAEVVWGSRKAPGISEALS